MTLSNPQPETVIEQAAIAELPPKLTDTQERMKAAVREVLAEKMPEMADDIVARVTAHAETRREWWRKKLHNVFAWIASQF